MCIYMYLYCGESGQLAYFSSFFTSATCTAKMQAVVQLPHGPFHKDKVM